MSGFINATSAANTASSASSGIENPLLKQAEGKIEANMLPAVRVEYDKIVKAGMHILLAKGLDGFMAKLGNVRDPISVCAKNAVALLLVMRKESQGPMPMPMKAGIPAGLVLMFHGLDFIDRAKLAKIAEPEIDNASTLFTNQLFHQLGITPKMFQGMARRIHGITQDPVAMQKVLMKAGLLRHPDAATPTPLPRG